MDATPADPAPSEDVSDFYTQAAGHPDFGITAFELNTGAFEVPEGNVKDIKVELPEGLGVNPEATEQCTVAQLAGSACPPGSLVGTNYLRAIVAAGPPPVAATIPVPVYNVEPPFGVPSMAGFQIPLPGSEPTLLVGDLSPADQHISFTISDVEPPPDGPPVIGSRLIFNGKAGDGYLTMPSVCAGGQTSILRVDSHQNPGVFVSEPFTTAVGADGCEIVPFDPTIDVTVKGSTDSPEPAAISLKIPYTPGPNEVTNSHLRTARVTLPEGMSFNPSAARGLRACTDAQFAKGTNNPIQCPDASKIGTVDVETPSLPPDSIGGTVYVGQPLSDDPTSGKQFRIFIHASSPRFGVDVRLVGPVYPDLRTGQLTAVIDDNPQAPFSDFTIRLDGGAGGVLTTPPTCGPHPTRTQLTPWTGNAAAAPGDSFTLSSAPGGRPCAKTLAERPFAPTLRARPDQHRAGAYSPFRFHFDRPDGAQELRRVELQLPPGMVARLRGVAYCPETSIAAATQRSGASVKATAACPQKSSLGYLDIDAGSGPRPLGVHGNVYLAGPYKGAPVSLVFVTPALAGPYDLGTVVVRAAVYVDPETAQVKVVSDPIPDVFGGVKLPAPRWRRWRRIGFGPEAPSLLAYSQALFPVPSDWSAGLHPAGHLEPWPALRDRLGEVGIPKELDEWMRAGPPPVFFGFGSMPVLDEAATLAMIRAVSTELGVRAVITAGWSRLDRLEEDDVFVLDTVDHPKEPWAGPAVAAYEVVEGRGESV